MNKELIEEWKEYNGYQVSNFGKVINKHGKYLSTNIDCNGYVDMLEQALKIMMVRI